MDEFQTKYIDFLFRSTRKTEAELRSMPEFKETFAKLDSINLLYREAQAIADGKIVATNTDAPENLLTVARSIQEQLAIEAFSKYAIPAMKGELEGYTSIPVENRRAALTALVNSFDFLEPVVRKRLGSLGDIELTDSVLDNAVEEAKLHEISFESMRTLVFEKWREYVLNPESVSANIDRIWETGEEVDKLINELSPELQTEIQSYAKKVYGLMEESRTLTGDEKEAKDRELDAAYDEIEEKFAHLPGVEPLFYYYLESLEVEDSYRRAGEEAEAEAEEDPPEAEHTEIPPADVPTRTQTVDSKFLVNDITGEVVSNEGLSFEKRVANMTYCVEGFSWRNVPEITDKIMKSCDKLVPKYLPADLTELQRNLAAAKKKKDSKAVKKIKQDMKVTKAKIKVLKKKYGDDWRTAYATEIRTSIMNAQIKVNDKKYGYQEAMARRQADREAIDRGEMVHSNGGPVSLQGLEFVYKNFKPQTLEDGTVVLVDKVTGKQCTSEKTMATYAFAQLWVRSCDEPKYAFTQSNERMYNVLNETARRMQEERGSISPTELAATLSSYSKRKAVSVLFSNENSTNQVVAFYQSQAKPAERTEERTR